MPPTANDRRRDRRASRRSADLVGCLNDRESSATDESRERPLQDTAAHSPGLIWRVPA
jgi:hypothetical protein